jgi:hypothetical protein
MRAWRERRAADRSAAQTVRRVCPAEAVRTERRIDEGMNVITTRAELGALWLPWYVDRRDHGRLIGDLHTEIEVAQALRVRDVLECQIVRGALEQTTANDPIIGPWSHRGGIRHHLEQLDPVQPVGPLPAWLTPEGFLLRDGCHRACALYELAPRDFELRLIVKPAPRNVVDVFPGLRR